MLSRAVFFTVEQAWKHWVQGAIAQHRTVQKTLSLNHVIDRKWKLHLKKTLDLTAGSPAAGKSVAGIIKLICG